MPTIALETGQKIKVPDGLSDTEIEAIVQDAARPSVSKSDQLSQASRIPGLLPFLSGFNLVTGEKDRNLFEGGGLVDKATRKMEAVSRPVEKGLTLGLSSQIRDLANYAVDRMTGGGNNLSNLITGKIKNLEDFRNDRRRYEQGLQSELPGGALTSLGLEFASGLKPTGAIFNSLSKLELLGKALKTRGVVNTLTKAVPAALARGATTTAITSALNPDVKLTPGSAVAGGAIDAGLLMAGRAAPFVANTILEGGKTLPFGVGKGFEKAQDVFQKWRTSKFAQQLDDYAKKTGADDPQISGREAQEALNSTFDKASKTYSDLKGAMLGKFGGGKASPEVLRKGIDSELKRITELAADLDPNDKVLKGVLEKWQAKLFENPTLQELDDITTTLYNASQKPNANPAFSRLYSAARENLLSAMDEAAVSAGQNTKAYKEAMKAADNALEASTEAQKRLAITQKSARDFPVMTQKDLAQTGEEALSAQNQYKNAAQIVDALDAANAAEGSKAKEAYRAARQEIAKYLRLKDGPLGKLSGLPYPEEVVNRAKGLGKLDIGSVVDEALNVNPEFKTPIKKVVLTNILQSADSPKNLQKAFDKYENVIPKLLSQNEIKILNDYMGRGDPDVVVKTLNKLVNEAESGPALRTFGNQIIKEANRPPFRNN